MSGALQVPELKVTNDDLATLGAYLLNYAGGAAAMGHVGPSDLHIYAPRPADDPLGGLVWDIFRTCAFDSSSGDAQAARARVHAFLWSSGWMHRQGELVAGVEPV